MSVTYLTLARIHLGTDDVKRLELWVFHINRGDMDEGTFVWKT